ncbi:hypothetical protein AAU61_12015 [Desulfocarbo indianensis]|nr:hypothetical protein AAU61_12015 [Desulfocarbo indianensis]
MDQSMATRMRLGLVHFMAWPELGSGRGPWAETVELIAKHPSFNAIEITHIEDPAERERVRDICRLAGLAVGFGAHPIILGQGLNLNALDEGKRAAAVSRMSELIDEAVFMEAESFVVLSGKDPGPKERKEAKAALAASLGELCAYSAARQGPKVVAEAFDCDVDKCCLLGPAPLAAEVAQKVASQHDNFGLLVDLSHIPLLGESPRQALEPVIDWLIGVHLGNAVLTEGMPAYGDNHPAFGTPGSVNGAAETAEFLDTLFDLGFLGQGKRPMVSFELKPLPGQDPELVLAGALRVLAEAWGRLRSPA